jgi:hypothetical protein
MAFLSYTILYYHCRQWRRKELSKVHALGVWGFGNYIRQCNTHSSLWDIGTCKQKTCIRISVVFWKLCWQCHPHIQLPWEAVVPTLVSIFFYSKSQLFLGSPQLPGLADLPYKHHAYAIHPPALVCLNWSVSITMPQIDLRFSPGSWGEPRKSWLFE